MNLVDQEWKRKENHFENVYELQSIFSEGKKKNVQKLLRKALLGKLKVFLHFSEDNFLNQCLKIIRLYVGLC